MIIVVKALVLCGIILMVYNIFQCFSCFCLQQDVILEFSGKRKLKLMGVYAASVLICVIYLIVMFAGNGGLLEGLIVFITSLFFTFIVSWMFDVIDGIKQRTRDISETLIGVIEAGDTNLDGHSLHVMYISMLIYDSLPYELQKDIKPENLRYASLLLDLGKLGIPSRVLNKPGKLESEEWDIMRRHPEIGVKVLKQIPSFEPICDWILYHHERVDGGGYYHLKGDEIPLEARIIAVADTYSAIVMVRSYKPSRSYDDALAALRIASGTQLDKKIVDIFAEIPRDRVEGCTREVRDRMAAFLDEDFRDD